MDTPSGRAAGMADGGAGAGWQAWHSTHCLRPAGSPWRLFPRVPIKKRSPAYQNCRLTGKVTPVPGSFKTSPILPIPPATAPAAAAAAAAGAQAAPAVTGATVSAGDRTPRSVSESRTAYGSRVKCRVVCFLARARLERRGTRRRQDPAEVLLNACKIEPATKLCWPEVQMGRGGRTARLARQDPCRF